MTVTNPTNEWYTTSQQSAVTASPRVGAVLHHGATTDMDQIINMETSGSRQVSSNRVAKDTRCARVVSDDPNIRAWSLSSPYYDSVLSSIECANESTDGWTISASSQETLAQMVAFWASTEGWTPHRDGDPTTWTVFGHREIYTIFGASYATACPGAMDLDWITLRARNIINGAVAGAGIEELMTDMIYYADSAAGPASGPIADGPNKGLVVVVESMWYAESVGAPLFALSGNKNYATVASATEYSAFAAGKTPDQAKRLATSAQSIADLIALRGTTLKPIGNFAGQINVGTITVPTDPALLAELKHNTEVTQEVVTAVQAPRTITTAK